ncbi:MAG: VOC family protein [Roseiarcus sp.]
MTASRYQAPCIFPAFHYRDATSAIDFLCRAFGFALHARHMHGGKIKHAELTLGSSMIMLGSVDETKPGFAGAPGGGSAAKSTYIAVVDPDALYARARDAGATILEPPTDRDYGSRDFVCADPEGHVWSFGTYWPKPDEPQAQ